MKTTPHVTVMSCLNLGSGASETSDRSVHEEAILSSLLCLVLDWISLDECEGVCQVWVGLLLALKAIVLD